MSLAFLLFFACFFACFVTRSPMSDSDFSVETDSEPTRALRATLAALPTNARADGAVLAVAYSGGVDSSALLAVAAGVVRQAGWRLLALHVHHGLSPHADAWLAHCQARCAALGIDFAAERVVLEGVADSGVEEAARLARYAALGRMCRSHGASVLLTAHHQDDQAETILLQLLRGAGLAGLSGMQRFHHAAALLGDADILLARPWLEIARADIERYLRRHAVPHIEDESNADARYARNALRHQVMPALAAAFPGFQTRLARGAGHVQDAHVLMREVAAGDLALCAREDHLLLPALRRLSELRFHNLMRYWFGLRGMRMPSAAWMQEMRSQLMQAGEEAQVCVTHPDGEIHRYRDRVFLAPRRLMPPPEDGIGWRWEGQASLAVPAWHGVLHLERIGGGETDERAPGFASDWLAAQILSVRPRSGGERIKLGPTRPARSLKQHYQSADVPAWQRTWLPLIYAGETPIFAAGIGMDAAHLVTSGERVRMRWERR